MAAAPEQFERNSVDHWKAPGNRGYEDELLIQYWKSVGGRIIAEAPVSGGGDSRPWPEGSHRRWLDGVRIPSEYVANDPELVRYKSGMRSQPIEDVTGSEVEIIEVNESLNRPVVGQAIVVADMFWMEYHSASVTPVIVVAQTDSAIEIVCEKRGIRVWTPKGADSSNTLTPVGVVVGGHDISCPGD